MTAGLEITLRPDFDVELIDHMGTDHRSVQAARTSTAGPGSLEVGHSRGLINRLIADRHGVPFEHIILTWLICAPIAVWREFMRHRHASFSEESARYRQLKGMFYIPPINRLLVQVGKPMDYHFEKATPDQYREVQATLHAGYMDAYSHYTYMIELGIAREVARMILPVGIYSTAMVTMNGRGLMNFLSLRVKAEGSMFPTNPQWEINQVADQMEIQFAELYPDVYAAFVANGRVCP